MMILNSIILCFMIASTAAATEFKHVGDFLLHSHYKVTGGTVTPTPMKPIAFHVFTDGVSIRVSAEGDAKSHTTFEIYRSDGIGRQRPTSGAMEVIPGEQAMTQADGVLKHLRLSRESMTITTFPGISDQTIISYAVAAKAGQANTKPDITP